MYNRCEDCEKCIKESTGNRHYTFYCTATPRGKRKIKSRYESTTTYNYPIVYTPIWCPGRREGN